VNLICRIDENVRLVYIEGVEKKIFDNTIDNIIESSAFSKANRIVYASLNVAQEDCPVQIDELLGELDFALYNNTKK
jgi:hypothetical protein